MCPTCRRCLEGPPGLFLQHVGGNFIPPRGKDSPPGVNRWRRPWRFGTFSPEATSVAALAVIVAEGWMACRYTRSRRPDRLVRAGNPNTHLHARARVPRPQGRTQTGW